LLEKLEKMGYIERDESKTRSIRLSKAKFPTISAEPMSFQSADAESITVPVIGKVTAGMPILAHESIERTFPVPPDFLRDDGFCYQGFVL
jgi:repressor LexA